MTLTKTRTPATLKPALRWMHRWLGLTLGVVLVVVCLSGSLLLFQSQFFRWAHGELIPEGLEEEWRSIDDWVRNARAAAPGLYGPTAIWQPHTDHNVSDAGMVVFAGREPGGLGQTGFVAVLIRPATGQALGVIDVDRSPAYAPLFLHGALWSGEIGRWVIGVTAVAALGMLAIGLYLWWPPGKRLLQKLSPQPWRNTFFYAGRLHDWSGAWALVFLIVLVGTGIYMVKPQWVEPALAALPAASAHDAHAAPQVCGQRIGFDTAVERARALVPAGALTSILPEDEADLRRWELIFKPDRSDPRRRETHVSADLECGNVALEASPRHRSPRESTEMWLSGLHDGSAFGAPGEILVTVIGIVPLVLLWTGLTTWLRRGQRKA